MLEWRWEIIKNDEDRLGEKKRSNPWGTRAAFPVQIISIFVKRVGKASLNRK